MVYTSIPPYIDQPNWQQQQQGSTGGNSNLLLPPPPPPQPGVQSHGAGSIRPGSMADRARMANIPMQEAPQKCPRCESTNTKFCYFNNYSLSQPRHFCKTCRRYWTRGGALRNVPVGGGCRRNKRSKGTTSSSSSKSSPVSSSAGSTNSASSSPADVAIGLVPPPPVPPLRFMAPLHHQMSDHHHHLGSSSSSGGGSELGLMNYGFNYGGPIGELSFHMGSANLGGGGGSASILTASGLENWRVASQTHQFPFLSTLEAASPSHGLYSLEGTTDQVQHAYATSAAPPPPINKLLSSSSISTTAPPPVKMEDNNNVQQLGLSRHFLGINSNMNPSTDQYWSTAAAAAATSASVWTDLSTFATSNSTTTSNNPL